MHSVYSNWVAIWGFAPGYNIEQLENNFASPLEMLNIFILPFQE